MNTRVIIAALFSLLALPAFTACGMEDDPLSGGGQTAAPDTGADDDMTDMRIKLRIGEVTFTATLADNAAARAFAARLPLTLRMDELNGNEKYAYLDRALPAEPSAPGTIRAGDLMLYGQECLVLFYRTFSSSYLYTRIGRLDDPAGLASIPGGGSVMVAFEKTDNI